MNTELLHVLYIHLLGVEADNCHSDFIALIKISHEVTFSYQIITYQKIQIRKMLSHPCNMASCAIPGETDTVSGAPQVLHLLAASPAKSTSREREMRKNSVFTAS